jgi:hypothetical protein
MRSFGNNMRPSNRRTTVDLVVGSVLGFVVGCVAVAVAIYVNLPPEFALLQLHVLGGVLALFLTTSVGTAFAYPRVRVWSRRRKFVVGRNAALLEGDCPACRYDLRGTPAPRCPECGDTFTPEEWDVVRTSLAARGRLATASGIQPPTDRRS